MRANQTNVEELFQTDDIITGFGEVIAVKTPEGLRWALPGNHLTDDIEEARHHAQRMDALIRANVPRFNRSLL